jgi:hypothetical protein
MVRAAGGFVGEERRSAGDPIPATCRLIEVHVSELNRLFNAKDPSPFRVRDLDPDAEEFIGPRVL